MTGFRKRLIAGVLLALTGLWLTGCGSQQTPAPATKATTDFTGQKVTVGLQYGITYLPLVTMVEHHLIEKQLPGIKVETVQLGSGTAIREAVLSGSVDVASMGVGPFIIGWDKGIEWKLLGTLGAMPFYMVGSSGAKSLSEIKPTERIAVPGLDSGQAIVLAMAAEKAGLRPKQFEANLIAMSHPDSEKALYAQSEIKYHVSGPPFQSRELKQPGINKLIDSYEIVGSPHTFATIPVTKKFKESRPEVYAGVATALEEAMEWVKNNPEAAADLNGATGDTTPKADVIAMLKDPQVEWSVTPKGMMRFATFMKANGFTTHAPKNWQELAWENLHNLPGN